MYVCNVSNEIHFAYRFGRKRTLFAATVPLLLAWILLAVAQSVTLIYLFAFLAGISLTCSDIVLPVYITEIASDHIRGYLGILHTLVSRFGLLYVYAAGPFLPVRLMAWLGLLPIVLFAVTFVWMPESPYHLLAADCREEAARSVQRLRCTDDVHDELAAMEYAIRQAAEKRGTFVELLGNRGHRRSLVVVFGIAALTELCGGQLLLIYAQTIFEHLGDGKLDTDLVSSVFGVVQLLAAVLVCCLVDTIGRRRLFMLSIVGSVLANAMVGVFFALQRSTDLHDLVWLPLVAIMTNTVMYTGIVSPMTVIMAEMFPKHLRGYVASAVFTFLAIIGLASVLVYEQVLVLGYEYVFFGFAVMTAAFLPFVWYLVPETKRRSLNEIMVDIQNKHSN